jgi:acetyltransferase-like isoleucine patch superfamily enzyme
VRAELLVFRFGGQLTIGDHCYVGENSRVWAGERLMIGNHVLISHDVFITDCNAHELDAAERAEGFQKLIRQGHSSEQGSILTSPVSIGDYAWINPRCTVLPGVTIGTGAIIGAGSVVTQDIPPFVLAAGSPARVIRELPQPTAA